MLNTKNDINTQTNKENAQHTRGKVEPGKCKSVVLTFKCVNNILIHQQFKF